MNVEYRPEGFKKVNRISAWKASDDDERTALDADECNELQPEVPNIMTNINVDSRRIKTDTGKSVIENQIVPA